SKDTSKPMILVWFGSEIRLMRLAGRMKRISEPPHLAARLFHSSPQGAHDLLARHRVAGRALEDHFAAVDHVNTVGNRRRAGEIRFGQQQLNSKSMFRDPGCAKPFPPRRGKALESFVEDIQRRRERHGAGNGDHFFLPAAEVETGAIEELGDLGKYRESAG